MVRNLVQVTHLGPSRLVRIIEFLRAYYFTRKSGHGLGRRFVKRVQRSVIRVSNENSSFFPLSFALLPSLSSFFFLSPLFTTVHILSPMQHARVSDYSKTAHVPGGSGSQPSPPTLYSRACTYMHRGRRGVSIRTSTPRSLVEPLSLHLADRSSSRALGSQQCTRRGTSVRPRKTSSPPPPPVARIVLFHQRRGIRPGNVSLSRRNPFGTFRASPTWPSAFGKLRLRIPSRSPLSNRFYCGGSSRGVRTRIIIRLMNLSRRCAVSNENGKVI